MSGNTQFRTSTSKVSRTMACKKRAPVGYTSQLWPSACRAWVIRTAWSTLLREHLPARRTTPATGKHLRQASARCFRGSPRRARPSPGWSEFSQPKRLRDDGVGQLSEDDKIFATGTKYACHRTLRRTPRRQTAMNAPTPSELLLPHVDQRVVPPALIERLNNSLASAAPPRWWCASNMAATNPPLPHHHRLRWYLPS